MRSFVLRSLVIPRAIIDSTGTVDIYALTINVAVLGTHTYIHIYNARSRVDVLLQCDSVGLNIIVTHTHTCMLFFVPVPEKFVRIRHVL